jgi:hypothetical protein
MTLVTDATMELFRSYQISAVQDIKLGKRPAIYLSGLSLSHQ